MVSVLDAVLPQDLSKSNALVSAMRQRSLSRARFLMAAFPRAAYVRTHVWRFLGPKTVLYRASGLFGALAFCSP